MCSIESRFFWLDLYWHDDIYGRPLPFPAAEVIYPAHSHVSTLFRSFCVATLFGTSKVLDAMQIHTHTHIRRLIVTTTWNILHGTYLRYKHLNNKISLSYYGRLMLPIVVRFLINSIFQYFRWISEIFCPLMFFPLWCHSIPFIHSVSISIYNLCHIELRMDFRFSRTIRSLLRYIGTHCTHSVSVCACVFVSRPSYVVCGWKEMWNVWHNQNDQKYYWWNFSCWFWFDAFVVIFLLVSPTPAPYWCFPIWFLSFLLLLLLFKQYLLSSRVESLDTFEDIRYLLTNNNWQRRRRSKNSAARIENESIRTHTHNQHTHIARTY